MPWKRLPLMMGDGNGDGDGDGDVVVWRLSYHW
jgi:hypothetical protein